MPVHKPTTERNAAAPSGAVVLDLGDLAQQADRLRDRAKAMARQIVDDARAEADALTRGAADRGHEAGHAKGLEEGRAQGAREGAEQAAAAAQAEYAALQDDWAAALQRVESEREALLREGRDAVLRVAVRLAERIVHRAVATDPDTVTRQLEAALQHVLEPATLTVAAHPDDLPVLERAMPRLAEHFATLANATLRPDPAIARGGCVVEHTRGAIDATLDTQLRRVAEHLLPDVDTPDADPPDDANPDDAPPPAPPEPDAG